MRLYWFVKSPLLSPDSLETVEINIRDPQQGQKILNKVIGRRMEDNEIQRAMSTSEPTSPRVTLRDIEACITYEYYITGDQLPLVTTAVLGAVQPQVPTLVDISPLACLTLCVLVLKNGFTVTGESACVSVDNFDAALGRKLARQKAIDKMWALEEYLLKDRLYRDAINCSSGGGDFGYS